MNQRAPRVLALVVAALFGLVVTVARPAWADGWENRIQLTAGDQTQTFSGPNALAQALAALPAGASTLSLQGDCEYESYQAGTFAIPADRQVALNLNGFDIDAEGFALNVQGSLTIANGTSYDTGDVAFEPWGTAPGIVVTGSLTLASGEISGDNGPAVETQGTGSFTMQGGKVDSDARGTAVIVAQGGTVAITGGSVENDAYNGAVVASNGGAVQVSGGTFEPTAIPAAMLAEGVVQVSTREADDQPYEELRYDVGGNEGILAYLNRLYGRNDVTVVNGTLNITQAIPTGITVSAQAPGVLQVDGVEQSTYTGTGQPPTPGGTTPNPEPSPSPNPNPPLPVEVEPVYRLYNPYTYGRYYTEDYDDVQGLVWAGWRSEGIGWNAPEEGDDVYQLYNPYNGDHYWTMNRDEYTALCRQGWRGEGDAWESAPASTGVPIYQLYNPHLTVNTHLWTADAYEAEVLAERGWVNEGAKWYAASLPQ